MLFPDLLREGSQLTRCQPPLKAAASWSDRLIKMNEAGACFFERESGARLTREHGAGNKAEMRLVTDTEHDGVDRQGGEQSKK